VFDVETTIVSQSREPLSEDTKQRITDTLNEALSPFGQHVKLAVLETRRSIAVYFICSSSQGLHRLRCSWRRGHLKNVMESLFSFLSGKTRQLFIRSFLWSADNYQTCVKYFCNVAGESTLPAIFDVDIWKVETASTF